MYAWTGTDGWLDLPGLGMIGGFLSRWDGVFWPGSILLGLLPSQHHWSLGLDGEISLGRSESPMAPVAGRRIARPDEGVAQWRV